MASKYITAHELEWGTPAQCTIQNPGNLIVDGFQRPQREVDIVCPSGADQPAVYHTMMLRADSERPTTPVWHNSRTGAVWIEHDAARYNGDDYDPPPTGSFWETAVWIGLVLAGLIGAIVGLSVGSRSVDVTTAGF